MLDVLKHRTHPGTFLGDGNAIRIIVSYHPGTFLGDGKENLEKNNITYFYSPVFDIFQAARSSLRQVSTQKFCKISMRAVTFGMEISKKIHFNITYH